jgi:hypothetical protein
MQRDVFSKSEEILKRLHAPKLCLPRTSPLIPTKSVVPSRFSPTVNREPHSTQKPLLWWPTAARARDGTWAELVAVPATSVRKLPEGISFEEGAALSNVGMTAYGALRHGGLKAGETLLVLGATGGVGSARIQLGKALGARVIAVVSKPAGEALQLFDFAENPSLSRFLI